MPKYTKGKAKEKDKEKGTHIVRIYWVNLQIDIRNFLKFK